MGYFKTDKDNDKPRGEKVPEGREVVQLQETQERLRPAECAAKEGTYSGGQCYK